MNPVRAGLCALALSVLAACGPRAEGPTAAAPEPTSQDSDRVIAYAKNWTEDGVATGSVEVRKPSDLRKLKGAPSDFIDFIGEVLHDNADASGDCDVTVSVDGIDPTTGVAMGGVGGCGGWAALWIRRNGQWMEATGTQMGWGCKELEDFRVPQKIVAPTCMAYGDRSMTELHYGGPGTMPSAGSPGHRVVYMTTLNADSSGADGVRIRTADDLTGLDGAPSRFIDHMKDQLGNGCTTMVYAIDPKVGIATGSAIDCDRSTDAHQIIWMRWHNAWIDVASAWGRWACSDLEKFQIPDDFTGSTCSAWDDDAGEDEIVGYEGPTG